MSNKWPTETDTPPKAPHAPMQEIQEGQPGGQKDGAQRGGQEAPLSAILSAIGEQPKNADTPKNGELVAVHYVGTLADGQEFDSSYSRGALQFILGEGSLIPAFERAVSGLAIGARIRIAIPAHEAYGPYDLEQVFWLARRQLPPDFTPIVGQSIELQTQGGTPVVAVVKMLGADKIQCDANHPLAGQDLTFTIERVPIPA
jgi:peptidylprolyl isomerase